MISSGTFPLQKGWAFHFLKHWPSIFLTREITILFFAKALFQIMPHFEGFTLLITFYMYTLGLHIACILLVIINWCKIKILIECHLFFQFHNINTIFHSIISMFHEPYQFLENDLKIINLYLMWCEKIKHMWQLTNDDMQRQIWKGSSMELQSWKPYNGLCKNPLHI